MMTSGSWRRAWRRASAKDLVCGPTPLADDGAVVGVDELDGVLDGDDVAPLAPVDLVDEDGQGGGLAGAGGAGHQHEAVGKLGEVLDGRSDSQKLRRGKLAGNHAQDRFDPVVLNQDVDAKAGQVLDVQGTVELQVAFELGALGVVEAGIDEGLAFLGR